MARLISNNWLYLRTLTLFSSQMWRLQSTVLLCGALFMLFIFLRPWKKNRHLSGVLEGKSAQRSSYQSIHERFTILSAAYAQLKPKLSRTHDDAGQNQGKQKLARMLRKHDCSAHNVSQVEQAQLRTTALRACGRFPQIRRVLRSVQTDDEGIGIAAFSCRCTGDATLNCMFELGAGEGA